MCGIAGALALTPDAPPVTAVELRLMAQRLRWRGLDDEGFLLEELGGHRWLGGGPDTVGETYGSGLSYAPSPGDPPAGLRARVGFAFRRLSILDLSPAGHQPMCDPTGRYWIVFNGEIYNYLELREELRSRGHAFRSTGDTEVLLAAFAEWGEDMLPHLNGMWGFALWDTHAKRLFCARDRFGVKPLYYRVAGGRFAFASELKPIVLAGERRPRLEAIHTLVARDWVDHTPETFFEGVFQLPAGHCLTVALEE